MTQRIEEERTLRELEHQLEVFSGGIFDHSLRLIHVHVLEIEDVLFHLNSAVMMPARPEGSFSSTDGTEDDATDPDDTEIQERQNVLTGLDVIAVALRQFDFDPNKRMLIAGHTDTSGGFAMNFELSDQRAKNVLYLIEGKRPEWSAISANRHRIEDYQQIMTWINQNEKYGWPCDPLGVDDKWGDNTKEATRRFVESYNQTFATPDTNSTGSTSSSDSSAENGGASSNFRAPLPPDLHERVNSDPNHKWPVEAWAAVYDIYQEEIKNKLSQSGTGRSTATTRPESPCSPSYRVHRRLLRFVSEKKYVGCGESFPVDDAERNNYRSQLNRRVEILFFDVHEVPNLEIPELGCPTVTNRAHTREECPLYNGCHYIPHYLDSGDLNAIGYHVKFAYYNRVLGKREYVPEGLEFQAYEDGDSSIRTAKQFSNGVYVIKVPNNPDRTILYFEFVTENKWIYTPDSSSRPRIVTLTPDQMKAVLPEDRYKYYDLPSKWSSRNYWTRGDDTAFNTGGRFEEVMENERQLKPYGSNNTAYNQPLVFSLDDVVLMDSINDTQDIKDADHQGNAKNLSNLSRLKFFVVDKTIGFLKLHQTGSEFKSARIAFPLNYLTNLPDNLKIIFFREGFYTIADKRTQESSGWVANKFIVGARAALKDDPDWHISWPMSHRHTEFGATGDFDFHYFHNMHMDSGNPVSFTISYVGINFMSDSRNEPDTTDASQNKFRPIPAAADVLKFIDEGCYRAMSTWNSKRYYMEENPLGAHSYIIRHFYFFDEREHFLVTPPTGGWVSCNFDNHPSNNASSNFEKLFTHRAVKDAERAALGGKPKFLGMICRDENGHWGPAYHWPVRQVGNAARPYSLLKLNKSCYQQWSDMFGGLFVTEHGNIWRPHTMAHELGHATGQADEYVRTQYQPFTNSNRTYANFNQHYIPYSMNQNNGSMMYTNCAPRLRYMWYPMHRLNIDSNDAASSLHRILPNIQLVARINQGSYNITYTRKLTGGNPAVPADREHVINSAVGSSNVSKVHPADAKYPITAAPLRQISLELFDVGKDESSTGTFHAVQGGTQYQAVLVVRVLMKPSWVGTWTNTQKRQRINGLQQAFMARGDHYRLSGGTGDIQNIYVHFLPGFFWSNDSDTENFKHYDISFTRNNNTTVQWHTTNTWQLIVDRNVTAATMVNYFFNRLNTQTELQALSFLKTFIDSKLPGTYTLQSFGAPL